MKVAGGERTLDAFWATDCSRVGATATISITDEVYYREADGTLKDVSGGELGKDYGVSERMVFCSMNYISINGGSPLPNIPWEERASDCRDILWRFSGNPVIARDALQCSNSIFNSAVVPFRGVFAGVFRVDDKARNMRLHSGRSTDGIH